MYLTYGAKWLNKCMEIKTFDPNQELVILTEGAARHFLVQTEDANALGVKLSLTGGGCAGFMYDWKLVHDISEINFGSEGYSCGTGDSFLTKTPKLKTDLVDMEAYAIAKICYLENIRFKCFKFISDHADGGASNDWIENVSLGKKLFVKRIKNLGFC